MAMNFKKALLAGTALVAVSFAHTGPARAANVDMQNQPVVVGVGIDAGGADRIVSMTADNNFLNIDLQGNNLMLHGTATGINVGEAGSKTGGTLYLYSTTTDGRTVTLSGDGSNAVAVGTNTVNISIGRDNTGGNTNNKVNLTVDRNVSGSNGTVNISNATGGSVIDFTGAAGTINLGGGTITLVANDQLRFTSNAQQIFTGNIAGAGKIVVTNPHADGVTMTGGGKNIAAAAIEVANGSKLAFSDPVGTVTANIAGAVDLQGNNAKLLLNNATLAATGGITGSGDLSLNGTSAIITGGDSTLNTVSSWATNASIANKVSVTGTTLLGNGKLTLSADGSSLQNVNASNGSTIAFTHTGTGTNAVTIQGNLTGATGTLENGAGELKIGSAAGQTVNIENIKFTGNGTIALSADVFTFHSNVNFDGKAATLKLGNASTVVGGNVTGGAGTVVMGNNDTIFAQDVNIATLTTGNKAVTFKGATNNITNMWSTSNLTLDRAGGTANVSGGKITVANDLNNMAGTNVIASEVAVNDATTVTAGSLNISNAASTLNTVDLGANTLVFGGASIGGDITATGASILDFSTNTATNVVGKVATSASKVGTVRISGTGTTTFNHADFYADNLSFTAAGTANLTATGSATAQAIDFAGHDGKVIYGDSVTFAGTTKSTGTARRGTLELGNNSVVKGAIGSATEQIGTLRFNGIGTTEAAIYADRVALNGGDVTAQHEMFAAGVHFESDNTLTLQKATTLAGNVTNVKPGTGAVRFAAGFKKIDGNVARLRELHLNENASVTGTLHAANVTNIGGHTLSVGGAFTADADTLLSFNVSGANNHGQIKAGGPVTISADTNIQVSLTDGAYLTDGQSVTLVDGTGGNGVAALNQGRLTQINTMLLSFVQDTSNKEDLVLRVGRTAMETKVEGRNNRAAARVLDQIGNSAVDPDIRALQTRLSAAKTSQALNDIVESITPDASGGAVMAVTNVANQTSTMVNGRLNDVRAGGSTGSGVATGNSWSDRHAWGQAFGATADQGKRGGVDGYDADTYGVMVGFDGDVSDAARLGLAFSYANTDVSGKDINRTSSTIDSWQVSLYGDYEMGDDYFLNGQVAYIYNDIEGKRYNVGGLAGNTANASYDSNQYVARAELGRDFFTGGRMIVTPSVSANYNYIDTGSYTETGAGGLNLRNVSTDHMQMLEFGAHLMASMDLDDGNGGSVMPQLHGGYRYDVIGDRVKTTAALAGGGAAFGTNGADPDQGTVNVGAGVRWSMQSDLELTAQYDYQTKNHYKEHSGYVRAGYRF